MTKLFLASKSPRRREILSALQLDFETVSANADEELAAGTDMITAGRTLAERKALAAAELVSESDAAIIAADTLVYIDGAPLGKPKDAEDAVRMLDMLSGRRHFVCTGMCLYYRGECHTVVDQTTVKMRAFSHEEALQYVATGEPFDKAGAYGIQGIGSVLVDGIDGDFFAVMGLSPRLLNRLLSDAGIQYFDIMKK